MHLLYNINKKPCIYDHNDMTNETNINYHLPYLSPCIFAKLSVVKGLCLKLLLTPKTMMRNSMKNLLNLKANAVECERIQSCKFWGVSKHGIKICIKGGDNTSFIVNRIFVNKEREIHYKTTNLCGSAGFNFFRLVSVSKFFKDFFRFLTYFSFFIYKQFDSR